METKTCTKCSVEKLIEEFRKGCICRKCENEYQKQYNKKHIEEIQEYNKNRYIKNKNYINERNKKYNQKNAEKIKKYKQKNEDTIRKYKKEYNIKNRDKLKKYQSNYYQNNKIVLMEKEKEYKNGKRKNDRIYALKERVRNAINMSFKRKKYQKKARTEEIIGCSIEYFINHLLKTYKDNYGIDYDGKEKVHIDHKKALKYATTEEEVINLCKYTNLQLLKAKDNLIKSSKQNYELKGEK